MTNRILSNYTPELAQAVRDKLCVCGHGKETHVKNGCDAVQQCGPETWACPCQKYQRVGR